MTNEKDILLGQAQKEKERHVAMLEVAAEHRKNAALAKKEAAEHLALHFKLMDQIAELSDPAGN